MLESRSFSGGSRDDGAFYRIFIIEEIYSKYSRAAWVDEAIVTTEFTERTELAKVAWVDDTCSTAKKANVFVGFR